MAAKYVQRWIYMLDEFALQPDPITWHHDSELRGPPPERLEATRELLRKGFIVRAGTYHDHTLGPEPLYTTTARGREYWERHVKGKYKRPKSADPIPRHSLAKRVLAVVAREVFDLARVMEEG